MPKVQLNGESVFYQDTGGVGPVLAFSHGILMDHEMFAPQVEAFRDQYRCVSWDERCHGLTAGANAEPFSYYDSADDLAAVLRHLSIKKAVLVGMSQGGFLSLRCALTHPDLVSALVLIGTQAGVDTAEWNEANLSMIAQWQEQGLSPETANLIESSILGSGWPGAPAWRSKWSNMKAPNLREAFRALVTRDDITEKVSSIKVPTLVIHGSADPAITSDKAEFLASKIPNAELRIVDGAAHAPNLTHAEQVNKVMRAFLQSALS
ncbi:alpha/beta fold hydrolase [Bradyrhizobium sp. Cp5.3]|uniref:alpha/beta fold hydrolase n=1 Tax=Bradyrhizobium sp. Cp5.3 TaxID=443598 RepID=UPI000484BB49|nr:alpha/beta hydrolase [Bradyrhizobium sp. Cp5.3]